MLKTYLFPLFFLLLFFAACSNNKAILFSQERLPFLIDSLYQADQSTVNIQPPDSAAAEYQRVIRSNFPYVEKIFNRYGFPGYDLVGEEASNKYHLLIQHSDFAPEFQLKVLKSMKKQVSRHNASGQNFAYLTDRVEINHGRPQIYGTQIYMSGNSQIKPCIDMAHLNERRQSVGLSTIEEYLEKCNETFYLLNPDQKRPDKN
ncbi:MAG: hypothetical protein JNL02_20420 [Saprospiraceae bacterium]|nr:hypothetical protein [Saprospiraceae bacterium]